MHPLLNKNPGSAHGSAGSGGSTVCNPEFSNTHQSAKSNECQQRVRKIIKIYEQVRHNHRICLYPVSSVFRPRKELWSEDRGLDGVARFFLFYYSCEKLIVKNFKIGSFGPFSPMPRFSEFFIQTKLSVTARVIMPSFVSMRIFRRISVTHLLKYAYTYKIDQFRYIKIQPKTINFSTRLWRINPTNSGPAGCSKTD